MVSSLFHCAISFQKPAIFCHSYSMQVLRKSGMKFLYHAKSSTGAINMLVEEFRGVNNIA